MNEQKALKAALLLSRVLCAHMEDCEFVAADNDCVVSDDGHGISYEDLDLHLIDAMGGALLLLRGMIIDVAEMTDSHPAEIARVLELTTSMNEAIGAVESQIRETPNPYWN